MGKFSKGLSAFLIAFALTFGAYAEGRELIPGGQLVGVVVKTDGLVYVGASDLGSSPSPARLSGLKNGDVITKINGIPIDGVRSLTENVLPEKENTLEVMRGDQTLSLRLTPKTDPRDGKAKIGAWVRESVAGLGTLTYIDPKTGEFAALGHSISDPDANIVVPITGGQLIDAKFTGVVRGEKGAPGELSGAFLNDGAVLGTIRKNAQSGIKGTFTKADVGSYAYSGPIEIAEKGDVKIGHAEILSTVSDTGTDVYGIDIVAIDESGSERNLLIKVTDQALLNATGGIVQGMSGSPIIQDGKLVGAVTHVLVNDPTRGYGIFIENMLKAG
ncbi:MAG: SpoIVB peptidase [Clostridia bacterium]|nr:SpoIVB peptidase [Clostridia bacterium]